MCDAYFAYPHHFFFLVDNFSFGIRMIPETQIINNLFIPPSGFIFPKNFDPI